MKYPPRPDCPIGIIAYVSDNMPTRGPASLFEQLETIASLTVDTPPQRVVVDSGSQVGASGLGANLEALIRAGCRAGCADVVVIDGTERLGANRRSRRQAINALLRAGFSLRDPSGQLDPSIPTVAFAKAASRRTSPRRSASAAPMERRSDGGRGEDRDRG